MNDRSNQYETQKSKPSRPRRVQPESISGVVFAGAAVVVVLVLVVIIIVGCFLRRIPIFLYTLRSHITRCTNDGTGNRLGQDRPSVQLSRIPRQQQRKRR